MPENTGAVSTIHLVLFGGGTHSEGDTDITHLTLGVLRHKSLSVGGVGEHIAATSIHTKKHPD
jgi:hypothetical protein